jgi:hypothetical protein
MRGKQQTRHVAGPERTEQGSLVARTMGKAAALKARFLKNGLNVRDQLKIAGRADGRKGNQPFQNLDGLQWRSLLVRMPFSGSGPDHETQQTAGKFGFSIPLLSRIESPGPGSCARNGLVIVSG